MSRILRASVLSLVLLLQGFGNAWALAPLAAQHPAATQETAAMDTEAMPCHGDKQAAHDADAAPASSVHTSCCGDDGACRCSAGCGATPALAPLNAKLDEYLRLHLEAVAGQPDLLPAHLHLLLRPPASFEG